MCACVNAIGHGVSRVIPFTDFLGLVVVVVFIFCKERMQDLLHTYREKSGDPMSSMVIEYVSVHYAKEGISVFRPRIEPKLDGAGGQLMGNSCRDSTS